MIHLRDKLAGIYTGQIIDFRSDDCPRKNSQHQLEGEEVTVRLDRFRDLDVAPRSVLVKVLDVWPHESGDGFVVLVRIQHLGDLPHLLHKRSWKPETHDPQQAMTDEPEAVDAAAQAKITAQADSVYSVTHADEQRKQTARSLAAQIKEETSRAQLEGVDIDDNIRRIRAELAEITRKRQDAA